MPTLQYISQITLPSGNTYAIKDAEARELIAGGVHYRGVTTTALTDGATTNPIQIDGQSYTAVAGDIVIYMESGKPNREFIFNGTLWNEFGVGIGTLGALAFKNSAEGTYKKATGGSADVPTYENFNSDLLLVIENEDKEEFVQSVTATKNSEAISVTATGGSVTPGSVASFTQGAKASFTQGAKASLTTTVTNETLTISFTPNGDDTFTPNGNDTFNSGSPTAVTLPTAYSVPANTVVVDVDDSDKGEALIDANLSTDDGSSTSKSVSVTTSIAQGSETTPVTVTISDEDATVEVE